MPHGTGTKPDQLEEEVQVIDFGEVRTKKLEEKRRKNERIFFKHLLGVYSVASGNNLRAIEVVDVSESGIAFVVPHDARNPWPKTTQNIPLRLYFSQDTYLEILVNIKNTTPSIMDNVRYNRFGCTVDTETQAYPAFQQFVRFLKLYSELSHKDQGQSSVFYL